MKKQMRKEITYLSLAELLPQYFLVLCLEECYQLYKLHSAVDSMS